MERHKSKWETSSGKAQRNLITQSQKQGTQKGKGINDAVKYQILFIQGRVSLQAQVKCVHKSAHSISAAALCFNGGSFQCSLNNSSIAITALLSSIVLPEKRKIWKSMNIFFSLKLFLLFLREKQFQIQIPFSIIFCCYFSSVYASSPSGNNENSWDISISKRFQLLYLLLRSQKYPRYPFEELHFWNNSCIDFRTRWQHLIYIAPLSVALWFLTCVRNNNEQ